MSKILKGAAQHFFVFLLVAKFSSLITPSLQAQDISGISPALQQKLGLRSYRGFLLLENPEENLNSQYSVILNFEHHVLESQVLVGVQDFRSAKEFIDSHIQKHKVVEKIIRELVLPLPQGQTIHLFWVGRRAYPTLEEAEAEAGKTLAQGIDVKEFPKTPKMVQVQALPETLKHETPVPSSSGKEAAVKAGGKLVEKSEAPGTSLEPQQKEGYPFDLDQKIKNIEIPGTKVEPEEDRFYMQIFGDYSFRRTNFDFPNPSDRDYFNNVVGFLTHRFGMRAFQFYKGGPYLQPVAGLVTSLSTTDTPFENKLELFGGVAYYPFDGLEFLKKRPYLEWLQGIHIQALYTDLVSLRKEFTGPTYDWLVGPFIWKQWGWGDPFDKQPRGKFYNYIWGEIFSDAVWHKTAYSRKDFESWNFESASWIGIKFPWIDPLPPLMPYVKLELNANEESDFFRNRLNVFYGVRYMPFHTERFKKYEWLFPIAFYVEYGEVESYFKDDPPDDRPDWDFRAGVKIDFNRF